MSKIEAQKAAEFLRSPAYPLFLYLLNKVVDDKTKSMLSEEDKDKLFILQKEIRAIKSLPDIFDGYSKDSNEEEFQ